MCYHSLVHHLRPGWSNLVSTVALAQNGFSAFKPSQRLIEKRKARRSTADLSTRKQLSFEIQRMHRQELRAWKSAQISQPFFFKYLQNPCMWKRLRSLEKHPVRTLTAPPHPNDFADMLETLFAGNTTSPERPMTTTEEPWQRSDLTKAIQRMKTQKAADECGRTSGRIAKTCSRGCTYKTAGIDE